MPRNADLASAPEPVELAVRPIVAGGTVLFAIAAIVVALIPDVRSYENGLWLWACVAGFSLGVLGLGVISWQKAR